MQRRVLPSIGVIVSEAEAFLAQTPRPSPETFVPWLAQSEALADWDVRDVYQACLGRLPEGEIWELLGAGSWRYASAAHRAQHIVDTLLCDEFRGRIVSILGDGLPGVQRAFFVHIPRTAGTSLRVAIEQALPDPIWHVSFSHFRWFEIESHRRGATPLGYMLEFLAQFARIGARLIVAGHQRLGELLERKLVRKGDLVFTLVRDPAETCRSALAHIVATARRRRDRPDVEDCRGWLDSIGCSALYKSTVSEAEISALMRSDRFHAEYSNLILQYLSADGTPAGVDYATRVTDCAILDHGNVGEWVHRNLGVPITIKKLNANRNLETLQSTPSLEAVVEAGLCEQDLALFDQLTRQDR